MENNLRCNNLKCRKVLNDHAVVTTCSHVYCTDCSNLLNLSGQREGHRPVCPACDSHLTNPDDVVVTNLNPTEDYKTSVLSGLHPNVIMECAGRALNFWAYQSSQEIVYQEYLAKSLTDKYANLNIQINKIVQDANTEVLSLRTKLTNLQGDVDALRRKNEELMQAFREKSRKQLQIQELYDKLKRRSMLGQVQSAASDVVDHNIQASIAANRYADRVEDQNQRPPPPMFFQSQQQPSSVGSTGATTMPPPLRPSSDMQKTWVGINSQGSNQQSAPIQTPSTHRQRLAPGNGYSPQSGLVNLATVAGGTSFSQHTPRQPLATTNANSGPNAFAGYGMSAGMKVSNPSAGANVIARPPLRSRVAQRTGSGFSLGRNGGYPPAQPSNMFYNGDGYY